jgi:hypothetical protein
MDRRPPGLGPESEELPEPPNAASPEARNLSEAEWDRILPPIDEDDPEWQAYARKKIREALDDPRPSIPIKEAFARLDARIAEYKAKRGL